MLDSVKDYYGRQLQSSNDLKTTACCDTSQVPNWLRLLLAHIHPEVTSRYYGCGLVCPPLLEGCRILDLGSGSGRDVYALAQLVGETGEVIGVDMTEEQLAIANKHLDYHAKVFGFHNVAFKKGYIEQLDELDLKSSSFDVIVSNCVINLSPNKDAVLREVHRLLKPGGEFYFSDVYVNARVPSAASQDPVFYGECLGGALYWNDFLSLAKRNGFADPRLVEDRSLAITDPEIAAIAGNLRFYSATYRLFKLEGLEPACEDYGQAVVYRGTMPEQPHLFVLDKHHHIESGRVFPVCGNTWKMLHETRFKNHFDFIGDFSHHFGTFDGCGTSIPFDSNSIEYSSKVSCC